MFLQKIVLKGFLMKIIMTALWQNDFASGDF